MIAEDKFENQKKELENCVKNAMQLGKAPIANSIHMLTEIYRASSFEELTEVRVKLNNILKDK
jgi:exonuclease VII small subunit